MRLWRPQNGKLLQTIYAGHGNDDQLTVIDTSPDNQYLLTGDTAGNVKKHLLKTVLKDGEHIPTSDLISDWFIKCHSKIINSISIFGLKDED